MVKLQKNDFVKKLSMTKKKLKDARIHKGLSQEELADCIGMTQPNYSRRENGKHPISNTEWIKIAKVLEVNKDDIYEQDDIKTVYKNIKENSPVNISGKVHYFNMPDFVLEHIDFLKEEYRVLKERLKDYEVD